MFIPKVGRQFFSTGIHIEPVYWDNKKKRIKDNHSNAVYINRVLKNTVDNTQAFEYKLLADGKDFTFELFNGYSHSVRCTYSVVNNH